MMIAFWGFIALAIFIGFLLFSNSAEKSKGKETSLKAYPKIVLTKEEVRDAVRKYSEGLPKGVYRTILVDDDHSINFENLAPILKGTPTTKFYMSKETYDIFEEDEKDIPPLMDQIQKAVDAYRRDHQEFPTLPFDPLRKVNYYLLRNENYIDFMPNVEFYITDYDGIISHVKPKKIRNS
ncbi:DUF3939 domain-containing protein [Pseudoneobacillus sp. C159]